MPMRPVTIRGLTPDQVRAKLLDERAKYGTIREMADAYGVSYGAMERALRLRRVGPGSLALKMFGLAPRLLYVPNHGETNADR